jgi:hypothetical protein
MAKGNFAPAKGGSCMPPFLLSHWRGPSVGGSCGFVDFENGPGGFCR